MKNILITGSIELQSSQRDNILSHIPKPLPPKAFNVFAKTISPNHYQPITFLLTFTLRKFIPPSAE